MLTCACCGGDLTEGRHHKFRRHVVRLFCRQMGGQQTNYGKAQRWLDAHLAAGGEVEPLRFTIAGSDQVQEVRYRAGGRLEGTMPTEGEIIFEVPQPWCRQWQGMDN